ncbi:MAG: hypothetical protein JWO91_53 [Acidobacteriaceae bacterium]|nr:hypothetical protein [Acidobacteriaceae bacterium]
MTNSRKSKLNVVLAIVLSASLIATGCSAQWISVALADLPVLVQMALNIGSLVTTLQSGNQLSAADAATVQNISTQASKDLNLLQTLYNEYKGNPSTGTLQQINNVISDIGQNLPALLQAAHVSDPTLSARLAAGVNLILTTVTSFASLIPQTATPQNGTAQAASGPSLQKSANKTIAIPQAKDLKKQWNQQVCSPTGKAALDARFNACALQ